ncbi:hypothetical protein VPH35_030082 [Triticum aestivum]
MLDPAGAEPFACAHSGVPAYAYYGHDREANEVMHDDEHLLKDILLGDAPLRQHLQRVVQKGMFLDSAAMDVLLDRQGRGWNLLLVCVCMQSPGICFLCARGYKNEEIVHNPFKLSCFLKT